MLVRSLRLAGYRMAREQRRRLPCIDEIARVLAHGPTADDLDRATAVLAQADDAQGWLL